MNSVTNTTVLGQGGVAATEQSQTSRSQAALHAGLDLVHQLVSALEGRLEPALKKVPQNDKNGSVTPVGITPLHESVLAAERSVTHLRDRLSSLLERIDL